MNYFAHGIRFVERPYFLAGTAAPDWLSVADRRVRLRRPLVEPFADGSGSAAAEVAAGVLQHLADDVWFHRTAAFYEVTGELTRLIRGRLGEEDGFRPGFLGHVVTELSIDAVLIERFPRRLDAYYQSLASIEAAAVERAVNRMARGRTDRLAAFIPLFCRERFLLDYLRPEGMLYRLNQVLRRIKLKPLPEALQATLVDARTIVNKRIGELLPAEKFDFPASE